jgi:hypothetical protein
MQTMRLNVKDWAKVNIGTLASVAANASKRNFVLQDFSSVMTLAGELYFKFMQLLISNHFLRLYIFTSNVC